MTSIAFRNTLCLISLSIITACGAVQTKAPHENHDNGQKHTKELNQGKTYFLRECGTCHRHYRPEGRTPSEWQVILAKKMAKVSLSSKQFDKLKKYILSRSEKALSVK